MRSVRTPLRAGTEVMLRRSPVAEFPQLHQITLPTSFSTSLATSFSTPFSTFGNPGHVQVYLIDSDPLTLVDTGLDTPESREALLSALDALGRSPEEIGRVILTHYHRDHLGQTQALRELGADLEVWAHPLDAPVIESFSLERITRVEETGALLREYGVPDELLERQRAHIRARLASEPAMCRPTSVERLVVDGERIPWKDFELEVIHTPGHTPGHIVLHEPESGTLLSGDHLMADSVPTMETYYLEGPPDPSDPLHRRPRFSGLPEYLASMRKLKGRSFKRILSSQGVPPGRPERVIRDAALYYDVRVQQIERGLRRLAAMGQDVTAWDLWNALFPNLDPVTQMRGRMVMIIGALDVLETAGSCRTWRRDDGVLLHRHT